MYVLKTPLFVPCCFLFIYLLTYCSKEFILPLPLESHTTTRQSTFFCSRVMLTQEELENNLNLDNSDASLIILKEIDEECSRGTVSDDFFQMCVGPVSNLMEMLAPGNPLRAPVLQSVLNLVKSADSHILGSYMPVLLPLIINFLDIENLPFNNSAETLPEAISCVLLLMWLRDRVITESALKKCGLKNVDSNIRLASILELGKWIKAMSGRFAFKRFTPYLVTMLKDPDQRVRLASYKQIVQFFKHAKPAAKYDLDNVLKSNGIQEDLIKKIHQNIDLNSTDSSMISSNSSSDQLSSRSVSPEQPPKQNSISPNLMKTTKQQNKAVNQSKISLPGSPDSSYIDRALNFDIFNAPQYATQPITSRMQVYSDDMFLNEIEKELHHFEGRETEHNWLPRQKAIQKYRAMLPAINTGQLSLLAVKDGMRMLTRPLCETITSMRTTLVLEAMNAIKDTAQIYQSNTFSEVFDPFYEVLAKISSGVKKITSSMAHVTMCTLIIKSPVVSTRQFATISQECRSIKGFQQVYALYWLKIVIVTCYARSSSLLDKQMEIEKIIVKSVSFADKEVRVAGRDLLWDVKCLWPEAYTSISAQVNPSVIKLMLSEKEKSSTHMAAANNVSTSRVVTGNTRMKPLVGRSPRHQPNDDDPFKVSTAASLGNMGKLQRSMSPMLKSHSTFSNTALRPKTALGVRDGPFNAQVALARPSSAGYSNIEPPSQISSNIRTETMGNKTVEFPFNLPSDMPVNIPSDLPSIIPSSVPDKLVRNERNGTSEESTSFNNMDVDSSDRSQPQIDINENENKNENKNENENDQNSRDDMDIVDTEPQDLSSPRGPAAEESLRQTFSDLSVSEINDINIYDSKSIVTAGRKNIISVLKKLSTSKCSEFDMRTVLDLLDCTAQNPVNIPNLIRQGLKESVFVTEAEKAGCYKMLNILEGKENPKVLEDINLALNSSHSSGSYEQHVLLGSPRRRNVKPMGGDITGSSFSKVDIYHEEADAEKVPQDSMTDIPLPADGSSMNKMADNSCHSINTTFTNTAFPDDPHDCKNYIVNLLQELKDNTAGPSSLSALSVLVTAMHTEIDTSSIKQALVIWNQNGYADELSKIIVPFLSQASAEVIIRHTLILLRSLLVVIPLDQDTLLPVLVKINLAKPSLVVTEVLIPAIAHAALTHEITDANKILAALTEQCDAENPAHSVLFKLRVINQIITLSQPQSTPLQPQTNLANPAASILESQFNKLGLALQSSIKHSDVSVRKEVYPLLVNLAKQNQQAVDLATTGMSAGQKKLLTYYQEMKLN